MNLEEWRRRELMEKKVFRKLKISSIITILLAVIAGVFLVLDYLALTDINHNMESDLAQEWSIVSMSVIPIGGFFVSFLVMIVILFRYFKVHKEH